MDRALVREDGACCTPSEPGERRVVRRAAPADIEDTDAYLIGPSGSSLPQAGSRARWFPKRYSPKAANMPNVV
jgi:hypothetical protein